MTNSRSPTECLREVNSKANGFAVAMVPGLSERAQAIRSLCQPNAPAWGECVRAGLILEQHPWRFLVLPLMLVTLSYAKHVQAKQAVASALRGPSIEHRTKCPRAWSPRQRQPNHMI